jgi:prevent-host-death family protein
MIINVSEAKAKLSKLVEKARNGEEVIIAKNNIPLVKVVPYNPISKRKLGLLKGQIEIPDDFWEENEEINKLFWEETYKAMVNEKENWDDLDVTL